MAVVLSAGVVLSAALVLVGFVASFMVGWTGSLVGASGTTTQPVDFSGLAERLAILQPLALVQAGLVVLIATPVVRVAVTALAFFEQRDRFYVVVSLIVLALLVVGLAILR